MCAAKGDAQRRSERCVWDWAGRMQTCSGPGWLPPSTAMAMRRRSRRQNSSLSLFTSSNLDNHPLNSALHAGVARFVHALMAHSFLCSVTTGRRHAAARYVQTVQHSHTINQDCDLGLSLLSNLTASRSFCNGGLYAMRESLHKQNMVAKQFS